MARFNNDYCRGAHPSILKALAETNTSSYAGYGLDEWCDRATAEIKGYLKDDSAQIHFLVGGTQTNYTFIDHALRPWESAISAEDGHINVHETGAVEHTGHKVETVTSDDARLTAAQIEAVVHEYETSTVKEHITKPKLVYLSLPNELGVVYSKAELEAIRSVCDEHGLYLYVDGARLMYALGSPACDISLSDLAHLTDAFYIGGTKCGALFGEALVITNPALDDCFRASIKQNGGLLAKGWLLGLQFATLFNDGLYLELGKHADEQAMRIRHAFERVGVELYADSSTNQQFVIVNDQQQALLAEHHIFELEKCLDNGMTVIRFCTSWGTEDADIDALLKDIARLA